MSAANKKGVRANLGWTTRFWAVAKYELLWNVRKKKLIGMVILAFVFTTLGLVLPVILSNAAGLSVSQNSDYVINSGVGSIGFFLFALVTVMNSISGEFESGTIVTLLTKPVSRTMVFFGKLFAAFITLLAVNAVLFVYGAIGATVVYGPQNNLHLVPLLFLGGSISTFVWVGIVLAIGSLSKSSLIAALGAFGIFIALFISAPIVSLFSDQARVLTYVPGSGATGYIVGLGQQTMYTQGMSVSTGTDSIAANLITCVLHPSAEVSFFTISGFSGEQILWGSALYKEPLSLILLRSIIVAAAYIFVFLFIAWYAFKRAQILE